MSEPREWTQDDIDHDMGMDDDCWNCGGEGRVNNCIDGCCVEQDNPYCKYCSRHCDVCNPPTPEQVKRGNDLRQVLAEADMFGQECEGMCGV